MRRLIDGVRLFVLVPAVLAVSATPAAAQTGKTTIGFTAGSGIALTENLKDYTHADLALQGHVTVGLVRSLAIRGEIGQTRFKVIDTIDLFCPDCRLDVDHMSVGVQYGGFGDEGALGLSNARVLPYGFVALGWYSLGGQLAGDLDFPSKRQVGFNAGFGINVRVNEHFGIQADVHLHSVSFDEGLDTDYWIAPQGGIWVSF